MGRSPDWSVRRRLGAAAATGQVVIATRKAAGRPFNLVHDTTSAVTLVFFGYSNCPDVCSLVLADIASALTRLDPDVRSITPAARRRRRRHPADDHDLAGLDGREFR